MVPYEVVREPGWDEDPEGVSARIAGLGFPVFTKPATLGSSVGIVKVHDPDELADGLTEAFRYARKAVVEKGLEGIREVECAVLGNDDPVASVAGEIVPTGHEFYDYEAKYLDDHGAQLLIPADLKPDVMEQVQRMAVTAFRAIECAGMARVDFFLRGEDELWVNEINTIPGFTHISMYPKLWEASGLSYPELVERLWIWPSNATRRSRRRARVFASSAGREPDRRAPDRQKTDGSTGGPRDRSACG